MHASSPSDSLNATLAISRSDWRGEAGRAREETKTHRVMNAKQTDAARESEINGGKEKAGNKSRVWVRAFEPPFRDRSHEGRDADEWGKAMRLVAEKARVLLNLPPVTDLTRRIVARNALAPVPLIRVDACRVDTWRCDERESGFCRAGLCRAGLCRTQLWESATKKSGTLESGILESGILKSGTLESGILESGTLESGILESGILESGNVGDKAAGGVRRDTLPATQSFAAAASCCCASAFCVCVCASGDLFRSGLERGVRSVHGAVRSVPDAEPRRGAARNHRAGRPKPRRAGRLCGAF